MNWVNFGLSFKRAQLGFLDLKNWSLKIGFLDEIRYISLVCFCFISIFSALCFMLIVLFCYGFHQSHNDSREKQGKCGIVNFYWSSSNKLSSLAWILQSIKKFHSPLLSSIFTAIFTIVE